MCSGISGKFRIILWALGLVFLSLPALAQLPTATILGTVTDQQDAVVVGAKVTAKNSETGLARNLTTGEDGSYRFNALPIGTYELQITAAGFETETRTGLTLTIAQEAVVNLKMRVGATTQAVTVSAEAPVVDTTNATLGGVVTEAKVQNLPLNGRNYLDLMSFQPGITQVGSVQGSTYVGAEWVSNGATPRSNNIMLDGAVLQNAIGLNSASVSGTSLGLDGIQEIKVITDMFTAEYGLTMGSQTVMASKSGTNQFHGDVFFEGRNSALDASNFFANANGVAKPEFQRDQFGAAFGGPIKKDKTFFWAVFEGIRENLGTTQTQTNLPEAGCRGPAGAVVWNGQGIRPAGSLGPCPQLGPDPQNTGLASPPNFVTISPLIPQFFPMIPLPNFAVGQGPYDSQSGNTPGDLFVYSPTQRTTDNYGQMRVDHNFSSADSFFVRYTADDTQQNVPLSNPGLFTQNSGRSQFLTLAENHIFSSAVINSFRLSYSRTNFGEFAGETGNTYSNANLKFPLVSSGQAITGSFGAAGWGVGIGGQPYTIQDQNIYTLSDDVFWNKGKHALKFGTLLNHYTQPLDFPLDKQGTFSSGDTALFLSGQINSFAITPPASNNNRDYLYNTYGFYAQDDFRVTPRLTVNLGLRYEFLGPIGELQGTSKTYSFLNFPADNPQNTPPGGMTRGSILQNSSLHNFGPRLGFAWDVFGDGKTSVRGGAGIFYDIANIGSALTASLQSTPPVTTQNQQFGLAGNVPLFLPLDTGYPIATSGPFPYAGDVVTGMDHYAKQPTLYQWNLSVERQLPGGLGLTVSYVGSRGIHLWNTLEANPAVPDQMLDAQNPLCGTPQAPANCTLAGVAPPSNTPGGITWKDSLILPNTPAPGIGCAGVLAPPPPATVTPTGAFTVVPGPFGPAAIGNPNDCRLNPYYGDYAINGTRGDSWYDALEVEVQKRVSHGFEFQSSYTYSRLEDTTEGMSTGGPGGPGSADDATTQDSSNPFNTLFDKGPSEYDATHDWTTNLIYNLPNIKTGSGFLPKLVNGWWLSSVFNVRTGFAFAPAAPGGLFTNSYNTYGGGDRPDFVTAANLAAAQSPGGFNNPSAVVYNPQTVIVNTAAVGTPGIQWFNPNMFAPQPMGQLGSVPRGVLRGPGYRGFDLGVGKDFKMGLLGEAGRLRFRAEVFNILNHPDFNLPSNQLVGFAPGLAQGAGIITSTPLNNQREVQLTLRLEF